MDPNCPNNFNSDSEENDPSPVETRCRVIKSLQEQLSNQTCQQNDLSRLKSQLLITEQACQMKEAEYKLRIDELEYELDKLKNENQNFKSSYLKNQAASLKCQDLDDNAIVKKYKKWKTKFHTLVSAESSSQGAAKIYQLETDLKSQKLESKRKTDEIVKISDENHQLNLKILQLNDEIKRCKSQLDALNSKNSSLQTQLNNLNSEKKKLVTEAKQKDTLLQYNRKIHIRGEKATKEKEQNANAQIKAKQKEMLELQDEMSKLKTTYDREMKEKKLMQKKFNTLKQQQDDLSQELNEQIESLKASNDDLSKKLEETQSSLASADEEISSLKTENTHKDKQLRKAEKVKENNIKLTQVVNEMQTTIENLQSSVSSFESDASAKTEQIRGLLTKNYAGIDQSMEWGEIIKYIDNIIQQLKSKIEENEALLKQLKKASKIQESVKSQFDESTIKLTKRCEDLERQLKQCKDQLHVYQMKEKDSKSIFNHAIRRKVDLGFYMATNAIEEMRAKLNGTIYYPVTMRTVSLAAIFAIRFLHYKNSIPYDGSTILEFARRNEIVGKTSLSLFQDEFDAFVAKDQRVDQMNTELKNSNAELQEKIKKLTNKCQELGAKIVENERTKEELQNRNNELKSLRDNIITKADYAELENKYKQKENECVELDKQMLELKIEMKRLLSTVDDHHREDANYQTTIDNLTIQLEQFKQANARLRQELNIAQTSLREKNREILAIERKLLKQKAQVVVVKDQIPTSALPPPLPVEITLEKKNNFYMTDSLRTSLAQMQNRLMKNSEMI